MFLDPKFNFYTYREFWISKGNKSPKDATRGKLED